MFQRIIHEEWMLLIPIISFFIFFLVFLLVTARAMLLRKPERERMASMPLENPAHPSSTERP